MLIVDHPYFAKHEIYFETLISNSYLHLSYEWHIAYKYSREKYRKGEET